jgi:hypothetical protein
MPNTPNNNTPKANSGGKPGRSGAPRANRNAMRHGLRGGQLPKDARYIELRLNEFRQRLEDAVMAARQQVSLVDAAAIQTCLRWERHAALAQRWLVKAGDDLKPVDRLAFSREIARASSERDKALAVLKLDAEPEPIDLQTYINGNVVK